MYGKMTPFSSRSNFEEDLTSSRGVYCSIPIARMFMCRVLALVRARRALERMSFLQFAL